VNLNPSKDIQASAALAAVCAATTVVPVLSPARLPAGLLLAFCLPGYALVRLLFPGRSLGRAELAACALGLSLTVAILGGLLLNLAPGHLGRAAWAVFLAGLTVACCAAASIREGAEPGSSYRDLVGRTVAMAAAAGRPAVLLPSLAAVAVTIAALVVSAQASTAAKLPLTLWLRPQLGRHLQVGVSPGAGNGAGLVLAIFAGAAQSRLAVPTLSSAHTYVRTLTVPAGATEITVDLDQGTRTLRHVQYWYPGTGSQR
jgi:hypothetical protein